MKRSSIMIGMTVLFVVASCESSTNVGATTTWTATLNGANERPNPVTNTSGTGTFTATINANNVMTYSLTFSGLTTNSNNAHIHGPGTTSQAVGAILDFNALPASATATTALVLGATSGTAAGTVNLNQAITATVSGDSLKHLFELGLAYVNVHTTQNTGGEIRGQITKQ